MREEKESITFYEEGYDSSSRYSKDGKYAYSIPEEGISYRLREGCVSLELKGRESTISHMILPSSFCSFCLESLHCLPFLRKITAFSEFYFVSSSGFIEHDVINFWRNTRLEEICVLPWLVDKYKKMFGYWENYSEAIVKVTAIPDDVAFRLVSSQRNGLITSKNGKHLLKVDKSIRVLEIPLEIEHIAATAFEQDNIIEKIIIKGNSEDYNKDRHFLAFDKDAVNSLKRVETLIFEGPEHTTFYDDYLEGTKIPNLKTIIYPLWNYNHFCFRGSEAESVSLHSYDVKVANFSSVELVEEEGIVYTKDGKFLVSGVDCKSKSIRIKDGVKEIFQYAFCCNMMIEEVYIPRSVTNVGTCAFKSCKNIRKLIFNFDQITKDTESAFFTYSPNIVFYFANKDFSNLIRNQYKKLHNHFNKQGLGFLTEKQVKKNSPNVVVYTLPYYSGEISIDENTFMVYDEMGETFVGIILEKANTITRLSLPRHIKHIDKRAFAPLREIEEISVPNTISAKFIYSIAKDCPKLRVINSGNENIIIENGIVYSSNYKEIIGISPSSKINFLNCKEGVENIAPHAFEGHKELTKIQLPQSIKIISERAFATTSLTEIVFPNSLEIIGKEAFASCNLSVVVFDGQIADGIFAFDKVNFTPSSYIKVQKIYRDTFIRKYPKLKGIVKTPLPKWLSWLE